MSSTIWFAPWKSGPEEMDGSDSGTVVVALTEFTPHRPWTAPPANIAGLGLRRTWSEVEGAVGLWLWMDSTLLRPRSGSVSVWREEGRLREFVARPEHLRVVRAYRGRGSTRSTTWRTMCLDRESIREDARSLLGKREEWPT